MDRDALTSSRERLMSYSGKIHYGRRTSERSLSSMMSTESVGDAGNGDYRAFFNCASAENLTLDSAACSGTIGRRRWSLLWESTPFFFAIIDLK